MIARNAWLYALAAVGITALMTAQSSASGVPGGMMAPNPTGSMADMRFLLGVWSCNVKLPSMTGGAPTMDTGSLSFEAAPGETIRAATRAKDYSADGYYGYDAKSKAWWSTGIDNSGNYWRESSKDGKVYLGTTRMAEIATPIRDTFTKFSASKIRDVTELQYKGMWITLADASCAKP
jgi:hypothetical protein